MMAESSKLGCQLAAQADVRMKTIRSNVKHLTKVVINAARAARRNRIHKRFGPVTSSALVGGTLCGLCALVVARMTPPDWARQVLIGFIFSGAMLGMLAGTVVERGSIYVAGIVKQHSRQWQCSRCDIEFTSVQRQPKCPRCQADVAPSDTTDRLARGVGRAASRVR